MKYNKLSYINDELKIREDEIGRINGVYNKDGELTETGLLTEITNFRDETQAVLNFKNHIGEYWNELASYRREDTYSNSNYISDGLNNAELFDRALEFIATAKKEIVKSSTLQHSINATLKNLLVMKEFSPIVDDFRVGNWLRIKVDDEIYKLRLLNFEIDYDNLDDLSVTFSDVKNVAGYASDVESVLSQASSMASSYSYVAKQASNGNKGKSQLDGWVSRGLDLTKMKIVDNADNQEVTWDSHGILCREYSPITDSYDNKQLKIIHKGLFLTDDNWKTSKAGIGNFYYIDPETNEVKEAYGVIANTLIGSLILSEKVKIFNKSGSVKIDENGLNIVANDENQTAFAVKRKNNSGEDVPILSVDSSGKLTIDGSATINAGSSSSGNTMTEIIKGVATANAKAETADTKAKEANETANGAATTIENIKNGTDAVGAVERTDATRKFLFNSDGLTVSKLKNGESETFKTIITEDGMVISENILNDSNEQKWEDVLTANNQGVFAKNLTATTYLIIGERSCFEDFNINNKKYTGCFWIGGE